MERLRTYEDLMETLSEQERYVSERKACDRVVAEKQALQGEMEQEQERRRGGNAKGWEVISQGGRTDEQYEATLRQPRKLTEEEAQVVYMYRVQQHERAVAEQKARDMVAAEEEARQRRYRRERSRQERRRQEAQKLLEARRRDRAKSLELLTQEQERRRKPMDVLNVLDVCVKEKNMVVKKNSKKTMDVAKEENGERLGVFDGGKSQRAWAR